LYSLFTDYGDTRGSKPISIKNHLGLDTCSGILLAASPWIFGFHEQVFLPHLILGITELIAVSLTDPNPHRYHAATTRGRKSTSRVAG
jgi:hypothetical protein